MITIVAPTAMIAKKLASVATWISVYELRKLLTVAPVAGSTCEPARTASAVPMRTMIRRSPACSERSRRLRRSMRLAGTIPPMIFGREGSPAIALYRRTTRRV